jgi:hypothetical protein
LLDEVLGLQTGKPGPEAVKPEAPEKNRLEELETLSDQEVEDLLWDKLRGTV